MICAMKERPTACVLPMPMAASAETPQNTALLGDAAVTQTTTSQSTSEATMVRFAPMKSAR